MNTQVSLIQASAVTYSWQLHATVVSPEAEPRAACGLSDHNCARLLLASQQQRPSNTLRFSGLVGNLAH